MEILTWTSAAVKDRCTRFILVKYSCLLKIIAAGLAFSPNRIPGSFPAARSARDYVQ